jgi:hypothetical protein
MWSLAGQVRLSVFYWKGHLMRATKVRQLIETPALGFSAYFGFIAVC